MLLNPKYLTDDKWHNVIFTIPDPKMRTRTPIPPPRKKRRSLIKLCTKRNKSVEYINLCSCQSESNCDQNIFDQNNLPKLRSYSSESDLFKKLNECYGPHTNKKEVYSQIKRCVSYENVSTVRSLSQIIKTRHKTNVLHSFINSCLLCYINEIMSLLEQLNSTNNDEYKFKLDDDDDDDHYNRTVQMYETEEEDEQQQDGRTILDKETKLSEINEQKLLESLENFCIHCYLNKIQTHPTVREDISSTSTKVEGNNLKSSRTGDNNNFSLANRNAGNKISPLGNTHDNKKFHTNFIAQTTTRRSSVKSACASSMNTQSFPQPQYSSLDKKYECLFCCNNKKKKERKHYNSGSLFGIYSKKQKYNVFHSDNTNEQECKYTIGNKVGNKIRNEKLCEINNAQNKSMHTHSNNMLEHFKNLNCCRRRHLNLFKFMCFQCFYVYVQILYVLQSSALFEEDFTTSLFKMRKCESMKDLSIHNIRIIVHMVRQIHNFFSNNSNDSNICKFCMEFLLLEDEVECTQAQNINSDGYQCQVLNDNSVIAPPKLPTKPQFIEAFARNEINSKTDEPNILNSDVYEKEGINKNAATKNNKTIENLNHQLIDLQNHEEVSYKRNDSTRIGFIITKKKSAKSDKNAVRSPSKKNENKEKDHKTPRTELNNKSATPKSEDSKFNVNNKNKFIQKLENTSLKEKFEKLKADLHAKKIESDCSVSKPLRRDLDLDVDDTPLLEDRDHNQVFDANGNYLETNDEPDRWSSKLSTGSKSDFKANETTHNQNVKDPASDTFKGDNSPAKFFVKRDSIKRKSHKLKRPSDSNPKDLLQIPGGFESRRSSVTDSLYELETSLYDMLQNSLALDDVEYI